MLSMNAIRPIFKKIRPRFNFSKLFKQSLSSSLIFAKADGVRGGRGGAKYTAKCKQNRTGKIDIGHNRFKSESNTS